MNCKYIAPLTAILALICSGCAGANLTIDDSKELSSLEEGFENPPEAARPMVWWHWMNGNITKDGIRKDLEWMKRIGLRGFHNFDASMATPQVVKKRLIYMDEGWKDAFAYATSLADSLGLEMTVASAPGWSADGGPWVEPKDGMKKLVWRTVVLDGGKEVREKLPEPFRTTGGFQNGAVVGRSMGGAAIKAPEYYEDVAVIAVKLPSGQKTLEALGAKVTSSGGNFTLDMLTDGDIADGAMLPKGGGKGSAWIQYEFPEPQTIKSVSFAGLSEGRLMSGDDGVNFTDVATLRGGRVSQTSVDVPASTAKYFRVVVPDPRPMGGGMFGFGAPAKPAEGTKITELVLYPYTRVERAEEKAGYSASAHLLSSPTASSRGEAFPQVEDVFDISDKMDAEGNLSWKAPEGTWRIYRFGFSLTGKMNHPAPPEATGLEVDKLDPVAWTAYFRHYLDMYKDASKGLIGKKGIQYILNDSYEAEHETWTPAMFTSFSKLRGYDLHKWLPVLAGDVIGSPEESDRFLFDWRSTLGDLIAANHDLLTKIVQDEYGMKGRYTEAHEAGRAYVGDGMDLKRTAQIPMSAMWAAAPWVAHTKDGDMDRRMYMADDKESASVAHIYGQNIAACESFTDIGGKKYSYYPGNLKFLADIEFANGINRVIVHESAHQPVDSLVPGMSLGGCGQWFNRHETWAEMAGTWVDYLARTSFMLQAGKNVADILYYYGEDTNITTEFATGASVPEGYQWDYVNPTALINAISYKDGKLTSQSGAEYRVLWVDRNFDYVSLPVLKKFDELSKAGAIIASPRPRHPASLSDDVSEWNSLVEKIWSRPNVSTTSSLDSLLSAKGIEPDVKMPQGMNFLHRTVGRDIQVYWVNRPALDWADTVLSFRVKGLKPQIWHTDSGVIEDASFSFNGDRTEVSLHFVPDDAFCVVFAGKTKTGAEVPKTQYKALLTIGTPWTVKFQEGRGAPAQAVFETLHGYQDDPEEGIKYFSGVAEYSNDFTLDKPDGTYVIDLGHVANIAEVWVNGKYCGRAWKEPYGVSLNGVLKKGVNHLEIKVANVWVNRLIGDAQPGAKKISFTDTPSASAGDSLVPAGLLGPVRIIEVTNNK